MLELVLAVILLATLAWAFGALIGSSAAHKRGRTFNWFWLLGLAGIALGVGYFIWSGLA